MFEFSKYLEYIENFEDEVFEKDYEDFEDEEAEKDLQALINAHKIWKKIWWGRKEAFNKLIDIDRRVSQWIENGNISPQQKEKMTKVIQSIEKDLFKR
jgi:hypothetical protein